MTPVERVLDLARWAPSGDNTQPWRFRLLSPNDALIDTFDTRRHCVYDLTGAPSQIAVGALLETARLAATAQGLRADIERLRTGSHEALRFHLHLSPDPSIEPSPLVAFIERRCTQRRPLSRRPLTAEERAALEQSVGPGYQLVWLDGPRRWAMGRLMFESSKIRLSIPEAFSVHRDVIEWGVRFSETKIPDQAVGLDPIGLAMMRWAMKSWDRTRILGTWLGGNLLPRVQLELLPALKCAAHVLICSATPAHDITDYIEAGAAVQRFWLTAEQHGLRHQPEMTPLIFAGYHRQGLAFSIEPNAMVRAGRVRLHLAQIAGEDNAVRAVWMGRIGAGEPASARSVRRPLAALLAR